MVIFHGVYVPQLPYPFICWWASRLLPCPYLQIFIFNCQLDIFTLGVPWIPKVEYFKVEGIVIPSTRILEWAAISFSSAWKWKVKVKSLSHVWLFTTLWTVAYQAPPSMGFSRQEYWSRVPLPSPLIFILVLILIAFKLIYPSTQATKRGFILHFFPTSHLLGHLGYQLTFIMKQTALNLEA